MPRPSINLARIIAGGGIFTLTAAVLAIMVFVPDLAKDDLFKMIAQAIVVQGLIGLVMAFLFTGTRNSEVQKPRDDPNEPGA